MPTGLPQGGSKRGYRALQFDKSELPSTSGTRRDPVNLESSGAPSDAGNSMKFSHRSVPRQRVKPVAGAGPGQLRQSSHEDTDRSLQRMSAKFFETLKATQLFSTRKRPSDQVDAEPPRSRAGLSPSEKRKRARIPDAQNIGRRVANLQAPLATDDTGTASAPPEIVEVQRPRASGGDAEPLPVNPFKRVSQGAPRKSMRVQESPIVVDKPEGRNREADKPKPPSPPIEIVLSDDDDVESTQDRGTEDDSAACLTFYADGRRRSSRLNPQVRSKFSSFIKGLKATYTSKYREKSSVVVYADSLDCLEEGEWLNDTVIDFYINYLLDQRHTKILRDQDKSREGGQRAADDSCCRDGDSIHVYSTFFWKKLTSGKGNLSQQAHLSQQLGKWAKDVDIFSKKYVFVPVCDGGHWSLALIYNHKVLEGGVLKDLRIYIIHLDSLGKGGHSTGIITKKLREYLSSVWHDSLKTPDSTASQIERQRMADGASSSPREFTPNSIPGFRVNDLPTQNNYCDCGAFLLKYLSRLLLQTPPSMQINRDQKIKKWIITNAKGDKDVFTKKWFASEEISFLRHLARIKLCELIKDANPDNSKAKEALKHATEMHIKDFEDFKERKKRQETLKQKKKQTKLDATLVVDDDKPDKPAGKQQGEKPASKRKSWNACFDSSDSEDDNPAPPRAPSSTPAQSPPEMGEEGASPPQAGGSVDGTDHVPRRREAGSPEFDDPKLQMLYQEVHDKDASSKESLKEYFSTAGEEANAGVEVDTTHRMPPMMGSGPIPQILMPSSDGIHNFFLQDSRKVTEDPTPGLPFAPPEVNAGTRYSDDNVDDPIEMTVENDRIVQSIA